jgi:23S rRNA pseudouridine2605 synthase
MNADVDGRDKPGHDDIESQMDHQNENSDKSGERIAKVIARAGLASRRTAEEWVTAGRVAVNGEVIHSPALNVSAHDRISVDGEPLPARERTRLFLYYKPRGLMTSHADPQGRPTIFERLPKELPRLVSVGRLDFNTEGLILLTNDGALARALELPATGWLRRYRVRAHGSVTQRTLDELRTGITVDGIKYREIEATVDRIQGANLWLTFAIREGKNREVRNVLGHLGLTVNRLIRVSFGPFQLGELSEGQVEEVPTRVLREQLGERLVELSGADFSAPISTPRRPSESGDVQGDRQRKPARSGRRDDATRDKPKNQRSTRHPSTSHSWRKPEVERPGKKLRRKFHGARRNDEKNSERPVKAGRTGVLTDRKGRPVPVERFGQPPARESPARESSPSEERKGGRRGRRSASDRGSGPRPRHPRSR